MPEFNCYLCDHPGHNLDATEARFVQHLKLCENHKNEVNSIMASNLTVDERNEKPSPDYGKQEIVQPPPSFATKTGHPVKHLSERQHASDREPGEDG